MSAAIVFPETDAPTVSIVVVAWRDGAYLIDCLRSIVSSGARVSYEVLVVLNEPTGELEERVARSVEGVVILRTRVNLGFGGAVNLGAASARGEYIVLLNDDADALPGWLDALVESAGRHPDLGAVGSELLFGDGMVQEVGAIVWSDASSTNVGRGLAADSPRYGAERRVDYCSGCSLLVPRSMWMELGGLDEAYFPAYYEDVDLCFRIRELGREVWVQPHSHVVHRLSASTTGSYRSFLLERNRRRFATAWADRLAAHEPPMPEDRFAVARAVARAAGEPARVLAVLDAGLDDDEAAGALERTRWVVNCLLGTDEWHVVVGDYPSTAPQAQVDQKVDSLVGRPDDLDESLEPVGSTGTPYALAVFAVRALHYEYAVDAWRAALSGVPRAIDAEVLRRDVFVLEEARAAELRAVRQADYVACPSAEVAYALGQRADDDDIEAGMLICEVAESRDPEAPQRRTASVTAPIWAEKRSDEAASSQRGLRDLGMLTSAELEALDRARDVREDFVKSLEGQVQQLLDEVALRDEYVVETENYARQLTAQIDELAEEIRRKNEYLAATEANLERLLEQKSRRVP